ncbi:hypothetical protein [Bacillus cereus]|uniref:hypothetical protein n=1 Tax=Bacillus cereus TaxID=1396 RepID=UPI000279C54B|nr:hypothetical protein [Bacillus cereus]EJR95561.1 hypothetical protein IKG_04102 [Bacillus cereus VD200]
MNNKKPMDVNVDLLSDTNRYLVKGENGNMEKCEKKVFMMKQYDFTFIPEINGVCLRDGLGYAMPSEKLKELAKGLFNMAEFGSDIIKEVNIQTQQFHNQEAYDDCMSSIHKSEFRKNLKRHWSFRCVECDEKISSKDGGYYYSLSSTYINIHSKSFPFFCSESCIKNYVKNNFPHAVSK